MDNKYTHIERLSSSEVEGILQGTCYVYPKLDGANASVEYVNNELLARSRKNILTEDSNLQGFYQYVQAHKEAFLEFFSAEGHQDLILFGEWLVPHTIKTYADSAWRNFYIFDVYNKKTQQYLKFEPCRSYLSKFNLIPLIEKVQNADVEYLQELSKKANYLITSGIPEGIVIKNYNFTNKFGRFAFAKIVNEHFAEKHSSKFKKAPINSELESKLVYKYLTDEYVLKEFHRLGGDRGILSKLIQVVFEEFVRDYISEILQISPLPTINFKNLKNHIAKFVIGVCL